MEHFDLEESNVLTAPAIGRLGEDEGELPKDESTGHRRVAAREVFGG